ncbi:hypothetical protein PGB90_008781 [Kerria lacca]
MEYEKRMVNNEEIEVPLQKICKVKKSDEDCTDFIDLVPHPEVDVQERNISNMFTAKKTAAQGMMDIALITANANQLRYLLEFSRQSTTFYTILALIIVSMCLQVVVGVFLIFKGRFDLKHEKLEHAIRLNNYVVSGVFLIMIINVFIAAFSVNISSSSSSVQT